VRLTFDSSFQNGSTAGRIAAVLFIVMMFTDLGFGAAPKVTLTLKSGPPTSNVSVSGSGFSAYAAIDIYFDTTDQALAIANASGAFSNIPIQVPPSALPGTHWVSAVQRSNGQGAQASFLVQTNWSEQGFTTKNKRTNPYENVLDASNVGLMDLDWSFTTGNSVYSSPAVVDGVVYAGSFDNNVYALNASTGAKVWSFTTGGSVYSSPTVANGVVYVGSFDDNVYALKATTGTKLWSFTTGGKVASSPTVANGVVYFGSFDDNVYALNATTGAKLWSFTTGNLVVPSPAVVNGVVYVGSSDGNVYALNATTGAKAWSFSAGTNLESSPAVANGVVYVGSNNDNLYALNASDGQNLWSFTAGNYVASSPAVVNGVVYVGSVDDNIYAFTQTGDARGSGKALVQRPDPAKLVPNLSLTPSKPSKAAAAVNTN
jgi:outer membrane protein assembly factor BamB